MARLSLILVLAGICVGCSDGTIRLRPAAFRQTCQEAAVKTEEPAGGDLTNLTAKIIAPGMALAVSVAEDASLNQTYGVPPGCAIQIAGVGRVSVCGLTTEELAKKIKAVLERDYFKEATVAVDIDTLAPVAGPGAAPIGIVYIMGAVMRPGPIQLPPSEEFTVSKAILAIGGFTQFAKSGAIKVVRYCDGRKYETTLDIGKIMKEGLFEQDVPLRNGDYVIVPEKFISL